ncbi:BA14K family protein [Methylobacterium sp. yr668]|uniref:BA14K family protein n=1 Tax=Methylobacterium sp. yr668 TaxID=1761801 RepID=UPI003297D2B7
MGRGSLASRGFRDDRRFSFRRGFGYGGLGLGLAAADFGYGYWPDYYYGGATAPAYSYVPVAYDSPTADPTATASQIASCEAQFKSYDPTTGTYLGYDGKRHPCS